MDALGDLVIPQRSSLGESTAATVRDAIFGGIFSPGQRIVEVRLAERLGVSRPTVREALTILEREGLVQRPPGQPATVIPLTARDATEIFDLRLALEAWGIRRALPNMTESEFSQLERNIEATEQCREHTEVAKLDLQFHEIVMRASDNSRLLAAWLGLRSPMTLLLVRINRGFEPFAGDVVRHHRQLLELFRAGDAAGAIAELERQARLRPAEEYGAMLSSGEKSSA